MPLLADGVCGSLSRGYDPLLNFQEFSMPARKASDIASLRAALREGDPQKVAALVAGGADLHFKDEHDYDALIDAVHGRPISSDSRLIEILELLIAHRVCLSGVSSYSESGLRVLSRLGRFDAIRLLLGAGADRSQLQWTPLMEAVALGTLADVEATLAQKPAMEEVDWWDRTAWLLAIVTGDIRKAQLLAGSGANQQARGRCGQPPLFHAITSGRVEMLRWVLENGAAINQTDDFGHTPLMNAVESNCIECVKGLLEAGADVHVDSNGTAINRAESRDIILELLEAGAAPAHMTSEGTRAVLGLPPADDGLLSEVTLKQFEQAQTRRFGNANPQRMDFPFWHAMIRSGATGWGPRTKFGRTGLEYGKPVWCANRFGQTLTLLPDGQSVQIGGEHEDHYDPDFCIYNDVFVHKPDGSLAILGYPRSVFPPTDFHTATLMGESIIIIGCLGYGEDRHYGHTPVYRLHLHTWRIEAVASSGPSPGWIYKHRAQAISEHEIRIWGGTVVTSDGRSDSHGENPQSFIFDQREGRWRKG